MLGSTESVSVVQELELEQATTPTELVQELEQATTPTELGLETTLTELEQELETTST